jgi:hypothetical protein
MAFNWKAVFERDEIRVESEYALRQIRPHTRCYKLAELFIKSVDHDNEHVRGP